MTRPFVLLVLSAAVLAGCAPDGPYSAHGTVEIREMDVSPVVPARIASVRVDEGDSVRAGDTIAVLTVSTLPADIAGREARLASAQAQLRDLERGARAPELERARADLRAATAEAARTADDARRIQALFEAGAVSRREWDAVRTAAEMAAARRDAARDALDLLVEGTRPDRIRAARAEVEAARAALEGSRATAGDLVLTAPASGRVLGRHADPGETVAAGTPIATIGLARQAWVRVFVHADRLPHIAVGDTVRITVPGATDGLRGRVASIADRAEFTPRAALTEEERADQLFGVRVDVLDDTGIAKAGMPASVAFPRVPVGDAGGADGGGS